MRFVALTGLPGVGKTETLGRLAAAGEQVLDLEALAGNRGSSFGRVGLSVEQPSEAEFHRSIDQVLAGFDPERIVWVEDEGPHIGRLWLPPEIVTVLAAAETVELTCSVEQRIERLTATYGTADASELIAATQQIRRRLGNSRTDRAISHFHAGRPERAIRVLLEYFDEGYTRRAADDRRRKLSGPMVELVETLAADRARPDPHR